MNIIQKIACKVFNITPAPENIPIIKSEEIVLGKIERTESNKDFIFRMYCPFTSKNFHIHMEKDYYNYLQKNKGLKEFFIKNYINYLLVRLPKVVDFK